MEVAEMNNSADENRKHSWDAVIRELVAKGEVSEDMLYDSDTIIRWWRSLDPVKQEEITNRVRDISQGREVGIAVVECLGCGTKNTISGPPQLVCPPKSSPVLMLDWN